MNASRPRPSHNLALSGLAALAIAGTDPAFAGSGAHWGYAGDEGPSHWGELDPSWHVCSDGRNQSPIDLQDAVDTDLPSLELHYAVGGVDEINSGRTIQIDYAPGSWITLDGRDCTLKQFHFHAPSENRINGREYP